MKILFIDPASNSTGWALFDSGVLINSGTIKADNSKAEPFTRLSTIVEGYALRFFDEKIDECHIERMNRQVHVAVTWSVGAIGTLIAGLGTKVVQDISPGSWQKYVGWDRDKETVEHPIAKAVEKDVDSRDELAAVCMGLFKLGL